MMQQHTYEYNAHRHLNIFCIGAALHQTPTLPRSRAPGYASMAWASWLKITPQSFGPGAPSTPWAVVTNKRATAGEFSRNLNVQV